MNYLPNAFAFIYVINVSHAGGMQKHMKETVSKQISTCMVANKFWPRLLIRIAIPNHIDARDFSHQERVYIAARAIFKLKFTLCI